MLSKVYHGHSFYYACRYIVTKQGTKVLHTEGVRSHDFKLMADDFILQQQLRPTKEKACFHCSLSFYPGEAITDELMVKLAKEYLKQLNIVDTQVSITKHTDRKHPHLHVIANLVNNKGKAISDSYLGLKGKKIAQKITNEYKLVPALEKHLELTNLEALRGEDVKRYAIYQAIKEVLPKCRTMEQLERKLSEHNIETRFKLKRGTKEIQGISFKLGDDIFKGSSVDRSFSYNNLRRALALSEKEVEQLRQATGKLPINSNRNIKATTDLFTDQKVTMPENNLAYERENLLEILMRPEQTDAQIPEDLLQKKRRKKKKIQRPGGGFN